MTNSLGPDPAVISGGDLDTREAAAAERIAQVCHEANRAYQVITGDPAPSPHWDAAPAWQRDSAVEGVRAALLGHGPEELHERWLSRKRAEGWVYGPVKDGQARTHPCMVPYAELPAAEQVKDRLFGAVVSALAPF